MVVYMKALDKNNTIVKCIFLLFLKDKKYISYDKRIF